MIRINGKTFEEHIRATQSTTRHKESVREAQEARKPKPRPPFTPPAKPAKRFYYSELGESF